jgi:hypothetical protein
MRGPSLLRTAPEPLQTQNVRHQIPNGTLCQAVGLQSLPRVRVLFHSLQGGNRSNPPPGQERASDELVGRWLRVPVLVRVVVGLAHAGLLRNKPAVVKNVLKVF